MKDRVLKHRSVPSPRSIRGRDRQKRQSRSIPCCEASWRRPFSPRRRLPMQHERRKRQTPMAIPADSCAAQRFQSNSPRPAVKYANAAMKLNQRTNGTMFPADTLISGRPNNILPPSKTVTPPNATARIPAATAHLGRPDTPSVICKTPCRSNVCESWDRVIRMIPERSVHRTLFSSEEAPP